MKKNIGIFIVSFLIFSCNNSAKKEQSEGKVIDSLPKIENKSDAKIKTNVDFKIDDIAESTAELGVFPYINPPENYTYGYDKNINKKDIRGFDKEYFAVAGKLIPVDGKTFKSTIEKDRSDGKRFNSLLVGKSFEEAILDLGGVNVNNVTVPKSEIERIGNTELIDKHYGFSIDYNLLDAIKTYIIKTKDKEIWIQYYLLNDESGAITILEKNTNKKT